MKINFNCKECDEPLSVEIIDIALGYPARTYGPPENCDPGEGPSWSFNPDMVVCPECGELHYTSWLDEHLDDEIRSQIADEIDAIGYYGEGDESL